MPAFLSERLYLRTPLNPNNHATLRGCAPLFLKGVRFTTSTHPLPTFHKGVRAFYLSHDFKRKNERSTPAPPLPVHAKQHPERQSTDLPSQTLTPLWRSAGA